MAIDPETAELLAEAKRRLGLKSSSGEVPRDETGGEVAVGASPPPTTSAANPSSDKFGIDWSRAVLDFSYLTQQEQTIRRALADFIYYRQHEAEFDSVVPILNRLPNKEEKSPTVSAAKPGRYFDQFGHEMPPEPAPAPKYWRGVGVVAGVASSDWKRSDGPIPPPDDDPLALWEVIGPLVEAGNKEVLSWASSSGLVTAVQAGLLKKKERERMADFVRGEAFRKEQRVERERVEQERRAADRAVTEAAAKRREDALWRRR